jgi:hypothetical protein
VTDLLQPHASDREADRRAREWLDNLDHQAAVGSRHHIVPKFLLARFASPSGQLRVRNRRDGKSSLRAIGDLGVRDFYTSVTHDAVLDSSLESLISMVEGGAAEIFRHHLDLRAFVRPRAFTPEERATLDTFVAMQAVRGMRIRRSIEVIADYTVKLLNQDKLSDEDVSATHFVPHPNDHLRMFGTLAESAEDILKMRSASLIRLDKPGLIIGDEPVLLANDDDLRQKHNPRPNMTSKELVLLEGRGGFANAEIIMFAVSPDVVLVYGPPGGSQLPIEVELKDAEAASFALEHNQLVVQNAIDWVAASPDHAGFASMKMSPPLPLVTIRDQGSAAAAHVNETAAMRPMRRLRHDDVLTVEPVV